jgi:hypothetical protein
MLTMSKNSGRELSNATVLHLTLGNYMHELDAAQRDPGATKTLKAEHRPRAALDRPMILLDNRRAKQCCHWPLPDRTRPERPS